jgi:hypothetical protein
MDIERGVNKVRGLLAGTLPSPLSHRCRWSPDLLPRRPGGCGARNKRCRSGCSRYRVGQSASGAFPSVPSVAPPSARILAQLNRNVPCSASAARAGREGEQAQHPAKCLRVLATTQPTGDHGYGCDVYASWVGRGLTSNVTLQVPAGLARRRCWIPWLGGSAARCSGQERWAAVDMARGCGVVGWRA